MRVTACQRSADPLSVRWRTHQESRPVRASRNVEIGASRSSGRGRQQLPVLWHDHGVDHVDNTIRRDKIGLFERNAVDLDA